MILQEIFSITKEKHAFQFGSQNDLEDLEPCHFIELYILEISLSLNIFWCDDDNSIYSVFPIRHRLDQSKCPFNECIMGSTGQLIWKLGWTDRPEWGA